MASCNWMILTPLTLCVGGLVLAMPGQAQDMVAPSTSAASATSVSTPSVQSASNDEAPPPAAPAPPAEEIGDTIKSIRASLEDGTMKLGEKAKAALVAFYGGADRTPLWVDDSGLTARANALLKELANADEHGLASKAYVVSGLSEDLSSNQARAAAEIKITTAVLRYARHAQGGRLSKKEAGSQLTHTPIVSAPEEILAELAGQNDAAFYLRSLHPTHPQFAELRAKLKEARGGGNKQAGPKIPEGPVLKSGVSHAHVKLLRQRLGLLQDGDTMPDDDAQKFDDAVEQAVMAFQKKSGVSEDGVVGAGTRKVLNGQSPERMISKLLINMERWRWLPDNLDGDADIYVWANIPELRVRIVKSGKTVFAERTIVGQIHNKTPVFSDKMEWIELHPTWFVPASIKVADIVPSLRRPTSTVMERYNLRVNCGALGSNYKAIDWKTVDVSKCSFTQPPGKKSVLGDFKFKFPNKYSVYMHDTHDRSLFRNARRTYSHGCVRIRNPRRMAEILLDHDKGITSERIGKILSGPQVLHKETLNKPVPVHMTYFTASIDDEGRLKMHPDYYGHDRRISLALTGKAFANPAATASSKRKPRKVKKKAKKKEGWANNIFQSN